MRIDDPNLKGVPPGGADPLGGAAKSGNAQKAGGTRSYKQPPEAGGQVEDQLHLSSLASKLGELRTDSPERLEKLEKLALEIEQGKYRVESRTLARKIVDETLAEKPKSGQ